MDIGSLKKAPGNLAACIDKTVVLGTAYRFYHNVSAGYKPTCLHVMFNNNVPGCLDIAPGRNTAYHIDGAIHLQLARHSGYVLPDNQHIGNQNASGRKLKFPVHFRPISTPVRLDRKSDSSYRFQLHAILGVNHFPIYIFAADARFRPVIKGNFLVLLHHLKGFYIDIVNSAVRQRRRNTRQIKSDKPFKPAVFSFLGRDSLGNQYFFIQPPAVNHIGNRIFLDAKNNLPPLQIFVNILFGHYITRNPRDIGIRLVSVFFYRYRKFFLLEGSCPGTFLFLVLRNSRLSFVRILRRSPLRGLLRLRAVLRLRGCRAA